MKGQKGVGPKTGITQRKSNVCIIGNTHTSKLLIYKTIEKDSQKKH
jgi:hypothetical protein